MILELIVCAILFLLGITYTFWGYKNLKKLISLGTGLIIFICVFYITMELGTVPSLIISFVAAVIAAILSHFFFNVGIFMIGAGLGVMIATVITSLITYESEILDLVISTFFFVLFGILAIKSKRVYLSAATAFTGAAVCCTSLAVIAVAIVTDFPGMERIQSILSTYSLYLGLVIAILGLIGFIIQLALTSPKKNN